jgi:polar amino acid transport system substrate-binding protein
MKVKCTFVAQDWDGIIPALLANKYDAIVASMSITEERPKKVAFTQKYYTTGGQFVVKKGGDGDVSVAVLKGKTVGAQRQTTHSSYLEDNYPDSSLKFYATQDEANLDLVSGRLDAVLADFTVLYDWLQTEDGSAFEFVGEPITESKWYGAGEAIAIRKENKELLAMFNKALDEIFADGTYKKINDGYFPFSIY